MTFAINVKGGTGAGTKRQREPVAWTHKCDADYDVFVKSGKRIERSNDLVVSLMRYSCPACGARRPDCG